jgi:hypothetical protein
MTAHKTLLVLASLALVMPACGPLAAERAAAQQAAAAQTAAARLAQTEAARPTSTVTSLPPTATLPPTGTFTPSPLPSDTPTPEPTATSTRAAGIDPNALVIYYFVVGGGEKGECGDRAIPFSTGRLKTGDPVADVRTALEILFGNHSPYVGGYENPIGLSNIQVDDVYLSANGKYVQVIASGTVVKDKENYCQWDRMRDQVKATLNRAASPLAVDIQFNGKPFNDFVSADHP